MKKAALALIALVVSVSAGAQSAAPASAAAAGPPAAAGEGATPDPTRLPGDRVFARGMHFPPPPAGASNGRPPPEPGSDAPGPSLQLALEAAQAALQSCKNEGYNVGVAVIDSSGQPRVTLSADGATGGHVYTGVRKGLTALQFGELSSVVSARQTDSSVAARLAPNMAPMAGAVPLRRGAQVIGAIGVSGASGAQDEKCASAGAERIQARL